MFTSGLIKNWKQSYHMVSKKDFLIFLFSWLKTYKRSLIIFCKYFWWLLLLKIVLELRLVPLQGHSLKAITLLISSISIYFAILSIRSSIQIKDAAYFTANLHKLLSFVCIVITLFSVYFFSAIAITKVLSLVFINIPSSLFSYVGMLLLPVTTIAAFFLLDKPFATILPIKSISCAFKGFFTYLPMFLMISLFFLAVSGLLSLLFMLAFHLFTHTGTIAIYGTVAMYCVLSMAAQFLFLSAIGVAYVKIKHSHYELFFPEGA